MTNTSMSNSMICNTTLFPNFLRYSMPASVSIDIFQQESAEWKFSLEVIYMTLATIQFLMSIVLNLFMFETLLQKKIRITSFGIYLSFFTLISLLGISIFFLRFVITLYFNDELGKYSLIYCSLSSVTLNWAQIMCLWIGAFISVERVLIECFRFSIYRSRRCAIISSLLLLLLTLASCITFFFGTKLARHPIVPTMHLCKMRQTQGTWKSIDEIVTRVYIHVVIPLVLHVLSIVSILTHIIRRKIILTNAKKSEWAKLMRRQLVRHKDFFIPSLIIIICTMPHFIFDELSSSPTEPCLEYSTDVHLRLHIALDFLYFLPQTLGFLIFIYPSKVYMNRFRATWTVNTIKTIIFRIFRRRWT